LLPGDSTLSIGNYKEGSIIDDGSFIVSCDGWGESDFLERFLFYCEYGMSFFNLEELLSYFSSAIKVIKEGIILI
jgi:hypothetical protein